MGEVQVPPSPLDNHKEDEVGFEQELKEKYEEQLKDPDFSDDETNKSNNNNDDGSVDSRNSHNSRGSKSGDRPRRSLSSSRRRSSARSLSTSRRKSKSSRSIASSSGHNGHRRSSHSSASPKRSSSMSNGTSSRNLKDNRRRPSRQSSSRRKLRGDRSITDDSVLSPLSQSGTVATAPVSTVGSSDRSQASSATDSDLIRAVGRSPRTPSSSRRRVSSKDLKSPSSRDFKSPRRSPRRSGSSRRRLPSSGSSKRRGLDDMSEQDEYTQGSATGDLLYTELDDAKSKSSKSHATRSSKPGAVNETGSSPDGSKKDKSYDKHHEKHYQSSSGAQTGSLASSRHSEGAHSKKTNGTRSSRDILYGNDQDEGDVKAKAKSRKSKSSRSLKPGVQYYTEDSYEHQESIKKGEFHQVELLYGENEQDYEDQQTKKSGGKSKNKKRAYRPGIQRIHGTRDILYGDEESKKMAMSVASGSRGSGSRGSGSRSRVERNDYDGYEYDFPVAGNAPREAYNDTNSHSLSSRIMVDSDIPADEPATTATASVADSSNQVASVKAGSVKMIAEKPRKKRSTFCIISGIIFVLLVLVLGVVGAFVFLTNDDDKPLDATNGNLTLATPDNSTASPTTPPTWSPSSLPSGSPTQTLLFDPPTDDECDLIRNNQELPGQGELLRKDFSINFDVTLSVGGDITDAQVDELIEALERFFVPAMVGCDELPSTPNRRLFQARHRKLNSRYVIGNADVTKIENTDFSGQVDEDTVCTEKNTQNIEQCHVVEVRMEVYLRGPASDFEIITVITNLVDGNLVPLLQLSEDTFSEVYIAGAETLVATLAPTIAPSAMPSGAPSQVQSETPTTRPTVAVSSAPTLSPVAGPTPPPTPAPTGNPTVAPSKAPSPPPTTSPSKVPTAGPSISPSQTPSKAPVVGPTPPPTGSPTAGPTEGPTSQPTNGPTSAPTTSSPTSAPTSGPTSGPTTLSPTSGPTSSPTSGPTSAPTECDSCFTGACDADTEVNFVVGCDSCDGSAACTSLTQGGSNTIGEASCVGADACSSATIDSIGDGSCGGAEVCKSSTIQSIGDGSCNGLNACRQRTIRVGDNSCTSQQACDIYTDWPLKYWNSARNQPLEVGSNSCQGDSACFAHGGSVGTGSCVGNNACSDRSTLTIADGACIGEQACATIFSCIDYFCNPPSSIVVAEGSCLEAQSCMCMKMVNEPNACQNLGDCCQIGNPTATIAGFVDTDTLKAA